MRSVGRSSPFGKRAVTPLFHFHSSEQSSVRQYQSSSGASSVPSRPGSSRGHMAGMLSTCGPQAASRASVIALRREPASSSSKTIDMPLRKRPLSSPANSQRSSAGTPQKSAFSTRLPSSAAFAPRRALRASVSLMPQRMGPTVRSGPGCPGEVFAAPRPPKAQAARTITIASPRATLSAVFFLYFIMAVMRALVVSAPNPALTAGAMRRFSSMASRARA